MFSMNTSSVDKYVHVCMVIYTSFISKRRKSFAAHFFSLVHLQFTKLSYLIAAYSMKQCVLN